VATVLSPEERNRLDAVGLGTYRTIHRESLDEILRDLRGHGADAVVLGLGQCDGRTPQSLARLVREFPRVPAVAVLTSADPSAAPVALALGQAGVSRLVDVRTPAGWQELRLVLAQQRQEHADRRLATMLREALPTIHPDLRRFFDALAFLGGEAPTVRDLARHLGVRASSLTSRFYRAGVPTPKRYLAMTRLVRAAALLENPGLSIAQVAFRLGYTSPQCFNRHIRRWTGRTAWEFRGTEGLDTMLAHFKAELVTPFVAALTTLRPFGGVPHAPPRPRGRALSQAA
jgi:AraC-like DNA-binding protein